MAELRGGSTVGGYPIETTKGAQLKSDTALAAAKSYADAKMSGNAGSATKLTTARTIAISGGATGTATSFDGSGNISIPITALDPTKLSTAVAVDKGGTGLATLAAGQVLVGNGTSAVSLRAIDATTGGTASSASLITSGAVQAGLALKSNLISPTFTGVPAAPTASAGTNTTQLATTAFVTAAVNAKTTITGNAGSATKLATARTIAISGGATGTATSFDGSGNISIPITALDPTKLSTAVAVDKGGTGLATLAAGQVLVGNGTGAVSLRAIDTTTGGTVSSTSLITSGAVNAAVGTLSTLKTSAKGNLVAAMNEVFQSASDGKTAVAAAITGKGVASTAADTFPQMATKISQISTGVDIKTTLEKYKVDRAGNLSAGDLVEFISGESPNILNEAYIDLVGSEMISVQLSETKALVVYSAKTTLYGTAVVVNIEEDSIRMGTPYVFKSTAVDSFNIVRMTESKVLIRVRDQGNGFSATLFILNIITDAISLGTSYVYSYNFSGDFIMTGISSTRVLITTSEGGGTAFIATVNGNSIAIGTKLIFATTNTGLGTMVTTSLYDDRVMVCYSSDATAFSASAIILTANGTTVTAGNPVQYSARAFTYSAVTLDLNRVVVFYQEPSNSAYGKATLLTVSGTTVTVSTSVVFNTASTTYVRASTLSSTKAMVAFRNGARADFLILSVVGTNMTVEAPSALYEGTITYPTVMDLSLGRALITYKRDDTAHITLTDTGRNIQAFQEISVEKTTLIEDANTTSEFVTISPNTVVMVYSDPATGYGTACVIRTIGEKADFGSKHVFRSAGMENVEAVLLSDNRILVSFKDTASPYYLNAMVLTVNIPSLSISSGTAQTVVTSSLRHKITAIGTNRAVLVYCMSENSITVPKAHVLTVSGNSITVGTATILDTVSTNHANFAISTVSGNKVVYASAQNVVSKLYGRATVLTIQGTGITSLTPIFFDNTKNVSELGIQAMSSKIAIITYSGGASKGEYSVLSMTDTGVAVVSSGLSFVSGVLFNMSIMKLSATTAMVFARNSTSSYKASAIKLTLDGTTVKASAPLIVSSMDVVGLSKPVKLDENRVLTNQSYAYKSSISNILNTNRKPDGVAKTAGAVNSKIDIYKF